MAEGPDLLAVDVDSTFIEQKVVGLTAEHAGTWELVAEATARVVRSELDFATSLRERVATSAGVLQEVLAEVLAEVRPTRDAVELTEALHTRGYRVGIVSGGLEEAVVPLTERLGIDHVAASRPEAVEGRLTDRVLRWIMDCQEKAHCLITWARQDGVPMERTIAVGDGANDLGVLGAVGLGVAFYAKPVAVERADAAIHMRDLRTVLQLIGG